MGVPPGLLFHTCGAFSRNADTGIRTSRGRDVSRVFWVKQGPTVRSGVTAKEAILEAFLGKIPTFYPRYGPNGIPLKFTC